MITNLYSRPQNPSTREIKGKKMKKLIGSILAASCLMTGAASAAWYHVTNNDSRYPGMTLVEDINNNPIAAYQTQSWQDTSHVVQVGNGYSYPWMYQPQVWDPQNILTVTYTPATAAGTEGVIIQSVTIKDS
jgi:hypothetical protein